MAVSTIVCSGVPRPSVVVVRSGSCPDLLFEQFVFSPSCVVGNYSQVLGGFLVGLVTHQCLVTHRISNTLEQLKPYGSY